MPKSKQKINVPEVLCYAANNLSGPTGTVSVHGGLLTLLKNVMELDGRVNHDNFTRLFNKTVAWSIESIHEDHIRRNRNKLPNKLKEIERQIETFKELYIDPCDS